MRTVRFCWSWSGWDIWDTPQRAATTSLTLLLLVRFDGVKRFSERAELATHTSLVLGNGNALETIHYSGVSCCVVHFLLIIDCAPQCLCFRIQQKVSFLSSVLATGGVEHRTTDDLDEQFGHKIYISIFDICRWDNLSPLIMLVQWQIFDIELCQYWSRTYS